MRHIAFSPSSLHSRGLWSWAFAFFAALAMVWGAPVSAQVGPSPAEVARYTGVHAAAHRGDWPQLKKLLAAGADVNARDAFGRTAVHIATFAKPLF